MKGVHKMLINWVCQQLVIKLFFLLQIFICDIRLDGNSHRKTCMSIVCGKLLPLNIIYTTENVKLQSVPKYDNMSKINIDDTSQKHVQVPVWEVSSNMMPCIKIYKQDNFIPIYWPVQCKVTQSSPLQANAVGCSRVSSDALQDVLELSLMFWDIYIQICSEV